jgi:hypothetical protein
MPNNNKLEFDRLNIRRWIVPPFAIPDPQIVVPKNNT